jgi:hypothetical protein
MDYAKIQEIPTELLVEHPENSNFMNAEIARKLRRHIERTGRYEPLTVQPHPSDSGSEAWEWLWENTTYSLRELKERIGTSFSEIALENKMKPLIGNRIIYPDGTVNSFVERYLWEQVVKLFEVKPKRAVKKG